MDILLAVDGSRFSKKAFGFVLANPELLGETGTLHVFHVEPYMPEDVKRFVGSKTVSKYQLDEATKIMEPMLRRLSKTTLQFKTDWVVGNVAQSIAAAAKKRKVHMIVMGTHGYNVIERFFMGSVAQRVVALAHCPVLLVK